MDVISLHQAGFDCAVASLGTALTERHAQLFRRLDKPVLLCYDSDEAGVKAAMRAIPLLREAGVEARVLDLSPYKDPDELIVHEGPEVFEERIGKAENGFLFQSDVWKKSFDQENPAGRTAFHRQVARELTRFTDSIERENYLSTVCRRHQIPLEPLRELVNGLGNSLYPVEIRLPEAEDLVRDSLSRAGKGQNGLLVGAAAEGKAGPARIRQLLRPQDMPEPLHGALLEKILAIKEQSGQVSAAALLSEYPGDEEAARQIAALFSKAVDAEENRSETCRILSANLQRLRKEALHQALRNNPDAEEVLQLTQELGRVSKIKITEADL